ncbi:hypothetical protein B0H13DRAFT_2679311 [Mycena leptocephala]|nr:hypothetical protein B0H13DRAFT_2679311 [Mycena leptocephala]
MVLPRSPHRTIRMIHGLPLPPFPPTPQILTQFSSKHLHLHRYPISSPIIDSPASCSVTISQTKMRMRTCGRVAGSRQCTHAMCKTCCEQQRKGCRYSGHRKAPAPAPLNPAAAPGDPSALSRPPPMFAYEPSSSTETQEEPLPPPKLYKKTMDPAWARRYNKNHEEQEERKRAEEQRRTQELMFERQVRFCFWGTDDEDPEILRQQGIRLWPKLNMADYPSLLKKLGLTEDDEINIYDFDGRCWDREDVNHVMSVSSGQVLLMRRLGVVRCPRLDEYILKYSPQHTTTRRSLPAAAAKRKRHASATPDQPNKFVRSSSPPTRPILPHTFSAPLRRPPPRRDLSLPPPSTPSSQPLTPIDPDKLWVEGRVWTPAGCGTWPEGMYARDMAAAFRLIAVGKGSVPDRFKDVFGLDDFPKGTWYQQQRAWKRSSQEERDSAMALPRTFNGLWTEWRTKSTGWAIVCAEKRR